MKRKHAWLIAFLLVALVGVAVGRPTSAVNLSGNQTLNEAPPRQVEVVQNPEDTVRNPYAPPVRHPAAHYAQLGYLQQGQEKLPLLGKPCPNQRRKWLYYTTVDGIKLPVEVGRRVCTVSPGCDELFNGDDVTVDGRAYKARLYEADMYEYDPFLERG